MIRTRCRRRLSSLPLPYRRNAVSVIVRPNCTARYVSAVTVSVLRIHEGDVLNHLAIAIVVGGGAAGNVRHASIARVSSKEAVILIQPGVGNGYNLPSAVQPTFWRDHRYF